METTVETTEQLERFVRKIAQKFPGDEEAVKMTDIHFVLSQESGELLAFDDDDNEITRCVVAQWIGSKDEHFYDNAAGVLRAVLKKLSDYANNLSIIKPYSFILENEDREHCAELYLADSDIEILGGDLMSGLDNDLNQFMKTLLDD